MAECLLHATLGHTLLAIEKDEKSKYSPKPRKQEEGEEEDTTPQPPTPTFRIIKNLDQVTFPLSVVDVFSRGKKVIFHLKHPEHNFQEQLDRDVYLIFTLGMEGKFVREKGKHSNLWLSFEKQTIYFDDARHFGSLKIAIGFKDFATEMKDLGLDILNDEIKPEHWMSIIRNPRIQGKQVCDFLMNQSYICGVGNYIKADSLYRARIKPDRKLSSLSDEEVELLRVSVISVARESYQHHGNTIKSYWDLEGEKGMYQNCCYKRKTDDKGNPIITSTFADKRTTHWCPAVQV